MSIQNGTETLQTSVESAKRLDEQHSSVVLHNDTLAIVGKMFTAQSDYENESKFTRVAMHTAVLSWAKQECRRVINAWENAVTKYNKLHPTMSRELAQDALLESKKNRETYAQVQIALSLLKDEFKS